MSTIKYFIGVDEVGRGPLAGPVTVGVVVCEQKMYTRLKRDRRLPFLGLDSKKLSEKDREKYAQVLEELDREEKISYAVVHIASTLIDTKGISFCIKKAMADGLKKLHVGTLDCEVRLDGGLRAPAEFKKQKTIIKGDEKEKIIAWASILAKVSRDSLMRKASTKYPVYAFHLHKGYGTRLHRTAISTYGLCPIHRRTFCWNISVK